MSFLKFDNVSGTTADIKLSEVVRLAIRNGYIDLGASASANAPDTAIATREDVKVSGGHMFQIIEHNGPLETIPLGTIPADGQKVYQYLYPQQYAKIIAGHQFVVTELKWLTGETGNVDAFKGCWSLGGVDEYGKWVRAPKLNSTASYRAPFLRGSRTGTDAGKITDDATRKITATITNHNVGGATGTQGVSSTAVVSGAAQITPTGTSGNIASSTTAGNYPLATLTIDSSLTVPTANENRPRYHGVIMCIRMFGTVSNPGSLDAAQLATDLAVANAKIQQLEGQSQLAVTGNAVMTGVDNKLVFTRIVGALKLEKGDVVRVVAELYNKLHTVESILNDNEIILNYEHCGGRGNGPLKLQDFTGTVTVTRIAKWFNAAEGLGQERVDLTSFRALGVPHTNTSGRTVETIVLDTGGASAAGVSLIMTVDGDTVSSHTDGGSENRSRSGTVSYDVKNGAQVSVTSARAVLKWWEIR